MVNKKILIIVFFGACATLSGMEQRPGAAGAAAAAATNLLDTERETPADDDDDDVRWCESDGDDDCPPTQPYDGGGAAAADEDIIRTQVLTAGYSAGIEAHRAGHFAVCSCQGARLSMEDAHRAEPIVTGAPIAAYFGVFDGHGGSRVPHHLKDALLSNLLKQCATKPLAPAITDAFLETNTAILTNPIFNRQGSTAIVACIQGSNLVVANAGDSRAVLCSINADKQLVATALSKDHKPSDPDEKARIVTTKFAEGRQGFVIFNPTARVMGSLAVARAFGDNLYVPAVLITPRPDVQTVDLVNGGEFLILACDGLWDVVSNEEACAIVMKHQANLTDASCALVE